MHKASYVRILLVIVFLFPVALLAQETPSRLAPIFLMPDARRTPLRTAAPDTRLRVLEEGPDGWVKVEFRDPQFGTRIGFNEARHIRIERPELEPMDLSVEKEQERLVAPSRITARARWRCSIRSPTLTRSSRPAGSRAVADCGCGSELTVDADQKCTPHVSHADSCAGSVASPFLNVI